MKNHIVYYLLGVLLCTAESCKKEEAPIQEAQGSCAPTNKIVKTVTNVEGIVHLDPTTQQFIITVHQPGTIDVEEIGVVCGVLPVKLQVEGTKTIFSGTYKEYGQKPAAPAGYSYYYLELSKAEAK